MTKSQDDLFRAARRPVHWLVRIGTRAGWPGQPPELPPETPIRDAWAVMTRAYGVTEAQLAAEVARYYRMGVADFTLSDPASSLLVSEALARKHFVVPIREEHRALVLATCDPTDVDTERAVSFSTGRTVLFRVAPPSLIQEALDGRFHAQIESDPLLAAFDEMDDIEALHLVEEGGPESVSEDDVQATPVVRLTNLVITDAVAQGASDIHIEPGRKSGTVRFRVDGVLRKHMEIPMTALNRVISRIKILSKLDIADRLRPQDGKARVRIRNQAFDLRVSTIPAAGSEKCVIRILDSNTQITLDDLDLPAPELARLRALLTSRDGIVVVTGPTGSGKTTTLYGGLRELADGRVNIMTVEDPVEYDLPSITQTQVETRQGVTFAAALRAILRQDPDIILVGEMRDRETVETASHSAMTGHLVLATVHANDAVSSVGRMADMGLPFPTIARALRGALAQRLLRRVCDACAEPVRGTMTDEEQVLALAHGVAPSVRAVGCVECGYTGYRGRIPVVEVLTVGPRFQAAVEQRKGWATLHRVAVEGGMRTMHEVALDWVTMGRTTLAEVERVLGRDADDDPVEVQQGPPRVLVVDDDADARLLLRTILEAQEFIVDEARGGAHALEMLHLDPEYRLIVLDLEMPEVHGRDVLEAVRASVDTAAIPILMRSGTIATDDEIALLDAGADDVVPKSADPARLMARIRAILRRAV